MTDPRSQSNGFESGTSRERVVSPVVSELSSTMVDVAIYNAARAELGDNQSEPEVFIATPYSDRSVQLVEAAQSGSQPPLEAAESVPASPVPLTLTARVNIEDLA